MPNNINTLQKTIRALESQLQACQAQLKQAETQQRMLDSLPDGYVQFDRDFNPSFLNTAGEQLYQQIHAPKDGFDAYAVIQATTLEKTLLLSAFESGQPVVIEFNTAGTGQGAVIEARYIPQPVTDGKVQTVLAILRETTGRKRVFEAQQMGESLIRAALAHAGVKVYTQDRELCYRWIYDQHFGLLDQAYPGKTDEDFYAPEEARQLTRLKRQVLDSGESIRAEMPLTINGEARIFELRIEPARNLAGQVDGLLCVSLDITERRRAAEDLARAEQENARLATENQKQQALLRAIVEVDPSGLAVVAGERLEHRFANPAYRAMLPHPEMDPIGRSYTEVWPVSEHFRGSWLIERVMQTGNPVHFERYPQLFADGSTRYYNIHLRRLLWEDQPAVLVVLWDVTESEAAYLHVEQMAAEAQEGREMLEAVMAFAPEGIAITDAQGQFRYISQYGLEMSAEAIPEGSRLTLNDQQRFWKIFHRDGARPAAVDELPLTRVIKAGETVINEEWIVKKPGQGQLYITCNAAPIRNAQGQLIGGLLTWQDITERREAAAALEQYAHRLEISNRELEQFASVASHDLQEPLRKIQAFSEMLVKQSGGAKGANSANSAGSAKSANGGGTNSAENLFSATNLDILNRMNDAATRMQAMINDLLTFSRVSTQARPMERVDLTRIVSEVLWNLEARLNSTQGQVIIGELPSLYADPLQMHQLFQNLIGNALKYHQPDRPPVVKVYSQSAPAQSANGKSASAPPAVAIIVEDNGIGFDPQYTERIFKPFERLHGRSEYEGTGMGLAICQKIVERHHGQITAQSQPGAGAMFIITLPVGVG